MNKIEKCKPARGRHTGVIVVALLFILAGLAIFARKQGSLDGQIYDIVISWPMLLVVLGLWQFVRREWNAGVVLTGLGAFFLIPAVFNTGSGWAATYWPLLLILVGVLIITGAFRRRGGRKGTDNCFQGNTTCDTEEGYVVSENTMGGSEHIVLVPVFKGARIRNRFGETVLDLRHTSLADGETYIDVDCTFGDVKLLVPHGWSVVTKIQLTLADVRDKRSGHNGEEPDPARKLILRGHITFGDVEIKN